ncbi:hypothetical protein LBYZC6_29960 [Lacrimispora brassicae]
MHIPSANAAATKKNSQNVFFLVWKMPAAETAVRRFMKEGRKGEKQYVSGGRKQI